MSNTWNDFVTNEFVNRAVDDSVHLCFDVIQESHWVYCMRTMLAMAIELVP